MNFKILMLTAAAAAVASAAVPAAADEVVFANITATTGQNFRFLQDVNNTANATFFTTADDNDNVAGETEVLFSLSGATTPLFQQAKFLLTGATVGDAAVVTTGSFQQQLDQFNFTIRASNAFTYGTIDFAVNDILLSGTISNATLTGNIGGSTGGINASTLGGATVVFAPTPMLTFDPNTNFGLAFTLNSVLPTFSETNGLSTLMSFRSQTSGAFQSDPAPEFGSPAGAVPEPDSWAMMIVGMGLIGFARRRRRVVVAA